MLKQILFGRKDADDDGSQAQVPPPPRPEVPGEPVAVIPASPLKTIPLAKVTGGIEAQIMEVIDPVPTGERTEQLFDLVEQKSERYPIVCLTGTTGEPFLYKGMDKDIEELLSERAEKDDRFDIVIRFDPARPRLSFVPDSAEGKSRSNFVNYPVEIKKRGEENMVMDLFDQSIEQQYLSMDRFLISIVEQLVDAMDADENAGSLCVIVENSENLFPDGPSTSNEKSQNVQLLDTLSKTLARSKNKPKYQESDKVSHHRIIMIDGSGKLGENADLTTKRNMTVEPVPVLTHQDVANIIAGEGIQPTHALVQLAHGVPIADLRTLLRDHRGQSADDIVRHLKFTKADAIRRLTNGALEFISDPRPLDTISLKPQIARAITTIAKQMGSPDQWGEVPNIVLQGPPGTGKTIIAEALAVMLDCPYFKAGDTSTNGLTDIEGDKWRAIIDTAIANKPCVLFIDELDKMIPKEENFGGMAGMGSNHYAKTIQYLQSKIGSGEMNGVMLVGATNFPENISEAFGRSMRFGTRLAMLPPETTQEKIDIARSVKNVYPVLQSMEFADEFYEAIISLLDQNIDYLTGADIEAFYQEGIGAWREACEAADETGAAHPTIEESLLTVAAGYTVQKNIRAIEERIDVAKTMHTYRVRTWATEGESETPEAKDEASPEARDLATILSSMRDARQVAAEIATLTTERDALKATNAELVSANAGKRNDALEAEYRVTEADERLAAITGEIEAKAEELQTLQAEHQRWQTSVEEWQAAAQNAETKAQDRQHEIEQNLQGWEAAAREAQAGAERAQAELRELERLLEDLKMKAREEAPGKETYHITLKAEAPSAPPPPPSPLPPKPEGSAPPPPPAPAVPSLAYCQEHGHHHPDMDKPGYDGPYFDPPMAPPEA